MMSATSGADGDDLSRGGAGGERDTKRARLEAPAGLAAPAPSPRFLLLGIYDEALSMLENILSAGGGELARGVLAFLRCYEAAPLAEASAVCRAAVESAASVHEAILISRCRNGEVSVLEAILGVAGAGVLGFLRQTEARPLCVVSHACRETVADHAWGREHWDFVSLIKGSLVSWRRCFPCATFANMYGRQHTSDADMVHLSGIHTLDMSLCALVTDAGLAHLSGIHTLYMSRCTLVTDAGLAHLSGIHTLYMDGCALVTDAGLAHLTGIRVLYAQDCPLLTAAGRAQLRVGGAGLCG